MENHCQLNRDTIALHNLSPCGYDLAPMKRGMKRGYEADFKVSLNITFFLFKGYSKSACFITTKEGDFVYLDLVEVAVVSLFFEGSLVPD